MNPIPLYAFWILAVLAAALMLIGIDAMGMPFLVQHVDAVITMAIMAWLRATGKV